MKVPKVQTRAKDQFDHWLRDYPRTTPVVVLCIALALVGMAAWSVEVAQNRIRLAGWQSNAADIASALERQSASDVAYLEATSALFASVNNVSPDFFRRFADRLRLTDDLNGVVGLGWSEYVEQNEAADLQKRMASNGFPNFALRPAPVSFPTHAITMLEPQTMANRRLIGFNMHSEARRAAAMDRALRTRDVAATDAIKLAQDASMAHSPGFLVYAPVWTVGQSRFKGFVYLPIRTREFVAMAVPSRLLAGARIEIIDHTPAGEETIFQAEPTAPRFGDMLVEKISVFDQQWTLRYTPPLRSGFYPLTLVILVGGVAFSMLLIAYILLVQRRNGDLQDLLAEQAAREKERAAFVREVNHRVKNSLANVTSIISLTRNRASDVQSFADTLLQRVRALATSHELLDGAKWGPADLRALIASQTGAHARSDGRIRLDGPDVTIAPNDALTVGLALHELLTNATRHGALSNDEGIVTIAWTLTADEWIEVDWQESGGPPVTPPTGRSFGLNLVERALAHELGRKISVDFEPEGVHCRFYINRRQARDFALRQ